MKKFIKYSSVFTLLTFLLISCGVGDGRESNNATYIAPGVGIGTIIAIVISWDRNKSILWAIIHGFLGWLYVIYALIVGKK